MLSTFTIRFRSVIWFLIFTFTLDCVPHLELLFPYRFHFFLPAAVAQEEVVEQFDPIPPDQAKEIKQADEKADSLAAGGATIAASSGSDLSGGTEGQITSPISFKVDDFTGAGHASYPIAVSPSRDRLQPKIELIYTSSGGNSWLGVGWDLTLGHIQRKGVRKGVPKYDDSAPNPTDVFELQLPGSGPQELVKVIGGTYAGEYRLKVEGSLLRIKYVSSSNSWEVTDKSGVKMKLGQDDTSRIGPDPSSQSSTGVFRWCLDWVEDPKTNYLVVSYQKPSDSPGAIYPSAIHYNGQSSSGLDHNHHIYFNLETGPRPDPIYNYRGGFKSLTMRRLASIEVKTSQMTGQVLVRRYDFQYVQNSQTPNDPPEPRSRLESIKLYGSDYGSANPLDLPPVRFTYQTHELGFQQTETVWPNPSAWGATKGNLIQNWGLGGGGTYTDVLDMNGDGRVDRVVYDRWTPEYETWGVYFNNGQDGFAPLPGGEDQPNWSNPSAWDDKKGNYIRNTDVDPTSGYNLGTFADVIDMDGDGLPDRVVYNKNCTSPYTDCPWTVYFNNGSGFVDSSPPPQEDVPNWENKSAWGPKNGNYIRSNKVVSGYNYGTMTEVVDMNGDGLPDRVVYDKDYVYHDPPDFQPANWKVYLNIYPNPNQDGLTGFSQSYDIWQNYSPWHNLKGNTIRTTRTDGSGTTADLIDMNGDGLPDRVVYDRDYNYNQNNFQAAKWKVYFNTGSGFEQDPIDWPNPSPWGNANGNNIRDTGTYGIQTDVIDVNGDGLPDRVVYDRTSPYTTWTVYFNYGAGFGPPVLQQGQPRPPGWDWPKPNPEGWGGEHDGNLISEHYYDGTYVYGTKAALFDIDGDGLPDRVLYKKNCNAPDEDCPWAVYLNKGPVTDLLSRIENGIGGATEITYKPSTAYEDGNGNKTNAIPFVVQTVYTYTVQDGRGAQYTHQYHYANADYDSAKVDFLGFGKVTAYQMRGTELEAKTETEFHQRNEGQPDEYRKGKPLKQTVTSHEDHKRETQYTWNAGYETLGGGKFPALDSVTTTVTDVGPGGPWSYSQTTRDVYDTNSQNLEIQTLNLLEEHKNELCPTCESEDEVQTVMEYGGLNWGSWILDKPTMVAVTKYVDAGTPHRVQSRKWMDYNDDGGLTTEELCRSDAPDTGCLSRNPTQNVITTYQYDPTYKVLTQVVDPRGFTTTMTYDSTKTFVYETEKCIEGGRCFKTTTLYDAGIGNITKSVPPHLQGTDYWLQTQYPGFPRERVRLRKSALHASAAWDF